MKHVLTAVIVVLVLALCAVIIIPTAIASRPIDVTVLLERTSSSLPFFFGQEQGIFSSSDVKLKTTFKKIDDPKAAIKSLFAGQAQFVLLPWSEALRWMSENPKDTLLCLFSVEYRTASPQDGFFIRKGLNIKNPDDLNGKRVAVGPESEVAMRAILGSIPGVDPAKVTIKVYPPDKLIEAVQKNEVDLALIINPYFTLATETIGPPLWDGAVYAQLITSPYPASGLFTTKKFFSEKPLAVRRMNAAIDMTLIKLTQQQDTSIAKAFGKTFGIDPERLVGKVALPNYQQPKDIDKTSLQVLTDKLQFYGAIPRSVNIEDMGIVIKQEDLRE